MAATEPLSTTFVSDFNIAESFGLGAVKDTFTRAFREWKTNYRYLTDLVITLNHKIWQHYGIAKNNIRNTEVFNEHMKMSELYDSLWKEADSYAIDNLTGEERDYFLRETD